MDTREDVVRELILVDTREEVVLVSLAGDETRVAVNAAEPACALASMYTSAAQALGVLRDRLTLLWNTTPLEESAVHQLCHADAADRVVTVIVRDLGWFGIKDLMGCMFYRWVQYADLNPPDMVSSSSDDDGPPADLVSSSSDDDGPLLTSSGIPQEFLRFL